MFFLFKYCFINGWSFGSEKPVNLDIFAAGLDQMAESPPLPHTATHTHAQQRCSLTHTYTQQTRSCTIIGPISDPIDVQPTVPQHVTVKRHNLAQT